MEEAYRASQVEEVEAVAYQVLQVKEEEEVAYQVLQVKEEEEAASQVHPVKAEEVGAYRVPQEEVEVEGAAADQVLQVTEVVEGAEAGQVLRAEVEEAAVGAWLSVLVEEEGGRLHQDEVAPRKLIGWGAEPQAQEQWWPSLWLLWDLLRAYQSENQKKQRGAHELWLRTTLWNLLLPQKKKKKKKCKSRYKLAILKKGHNCKI